MSDVQHGVSSIFLVGFHVNNTNKNINNFKTNVIMFGKCSLWETDVGDVLYVQRNSLNTCTGSYTWMHAEKSKGTVIQHRCDSSTFLLQGRCVHQAGAVQAGSSCLLSVLAGSIMWPHGSWHTWPSEVLLCGTSQELKELCVCIRLCGRKAPPPLLINRKLNVDYMKTDYIQIHKSCENCDSTIG